MYILSHLLFFFFFLIKFLTLFSSQLFQVVLQSRFPDTRAVHSCTAGGAKGMLCRCWLRGKNTLCKRSCWEANEHLSFVIAVWVHKIKPHFLFLFFSSFFCLLEIIVCHPNKLYRETDTAGVWQQKWNRTVSQF